jgi:hypothetical protein
MIKKQLMYIPLRRRFMLYLLENNLTTFTSKVARLWYEKEKGAKGGTVPYSNLHVVLLKPLFMEGQISRVERGLWLVTPNPNSICGDQYQSAEHLISDLELDDEWAEHVRQKLGLSPDPVK